MDKSVNRSAMRSVSIYDVGSSATKLDLDEDVPIPTFEALLPNICTTFNCPVPVIVRKEVQKDDIVKMMKKAEPPRKSQKIKFVAEITSLDISAMKTMAGDIASLVTVDSCLADPNTVIVSAIYDLHDHLVEISINKALNLPRVVMQAIGALVPYLGYLTKISISKTKIDAYVVHELQKIQLNSFLTEITLEDAEVPQGSYAMLLDRDVKNLTLCRCKIDDAVCSEIASKLNMYAVAEPKLKLLNLSSNHITDVGAKHLADALRTNRNLRYLNLADNQITDNGVRFFMESLCEFPLTADELTDKRKRYISYLRKRIDLVNKYFIKSLEDMRPSENFGPSLNTAKTIKKKETSASLLTRNTKKDKSELGRDSSTDLEHSFKLKAEMIAGEIMGPFKDPFNESHTVNKNDWVYCHGNMVLASLNLSYNKLTYLSLKSIEDMLVYQENNRKIGSTGLVRMVIEGNNLPGTCPEMVNITNILNRNLSRFSGKLNSSMSASSARSNTSGRKPSKVKK